MRDTRHVHQFGRPFVRWVFFLHCCKGVWSRLDWMILATENSGGRALMFPSSNFELTAARNKSLALDDFPSYSSSCSSPASVLWNSRSTIRFLTTFAILRLRPDRFGCFKMLEAKHSSRFQCSISDGLPMMDCRMSVSAFEHANLEPLGICFITMPLLCR